MDAVRTSIAGLAAWAVLGAAAAAPEGASAAVSQDVPPAEGDTAAAPEAAQVPVRTLVPARLERGPTTRVPHLQDGLLFSNEKKTPTDLPPDRKQQLLGRSGNDWLVANGTRGRLRVHEVNRKEPPRRLRNSQWEGTGLTVRLARGGALLVLGASRRENTDFRVLRGLDGAVVGTWGEGYDADPRPLDVADGRVVLDAVPGPSDASSAVEWFPGAGPRDLGVAANAADVRRDLLFVEGASPGRHGPTSYAAPGSPAWSAPFVALDVSPNGRKVIGTGSRLVRGRAVLQVRRMSDGTLLQQFSYGARVDPALWDPEAGPQTARFEANRRIVFEIADRGRATLVRCTAGGRCTRASRTGGPVSVPYERVRW